MREVKLKMIRKLADKKERDRTSLFVIEGPHLIEEALKSGARIKLIVYSNDRNGEVIEKAKNKNIGTIRAGENELKKLSDTKTPQGIIGVVEKLKNDEDPLINAKDAFLLICEGIRDPGNLGSMIRTAAAAGCTGVFISGDSVDIYNPKVVRATGGSLFKVPVKAEADIRQVIKNLKNNKIAVFGTDAGAAPSVYSCILKRPFAVIIGSEGSGIKKEILSMCDRTVSVPMEAGVESLNASVSAAVVLFEAKRQNGHRKSGFETRPYKGK
jgi:TrmH family RNA methyltransferase